MVDLGIVEVLHQHAAEAVDRVDRRAVGPRHRRQRVIGAEQVARSVDQVEVLQGFAAGGGCRSFGFAMAKAYHAQKGRSETGCTLFPTGLNPRRHWGVAGLF